MTAPVPLPPFPHEALDRLLPLAFEEDEGSGDLTTLATIPESMDGVAVLSAKEPGVVAGLPAVERIFGYRGSVPRIVLHRKDGDEVAAGDAVLTLEGSLRSLLTCERIVLNVLQRMSGIATAARAHVRALEGSRTRLLDTRKTVPGWRALDKYAVAGGGGANHRHGLFDQVLIKDNHAAACGSIRAAVDKVDTAYRGAHPVEAEVRALDELKTLLDSAVDIVLLDNMDDATLIAAVALVRAEAPSIKLEASGNMTLERLRRIKDIGLDYVSVGALTHSVRALDLSLNITGRP
ncbi:MAG TPA: carboxylating nicotinate-nucleotide diphosphorylase [Fibrobacteria bacterium]|nr:carboxylating nicotinate-nucleotide diphosphorylase [Fibrobacteria bacterium]